MVIDSMQVSPLHLPFQAWPLMMAPVYGGGGAAASPGYTGSLMSSLVGSPGPTITGFFGQPQPGGQPGQTMSGLGSFVPFQAMPVMGPWGRQPVYMGGQFAPQAAMVPFQTTPATEQQALDSLMQEVTAGPIRKLHDYLEIYSCPGGGQSLRRPRLHPGSRADLSGLSLHLGVTRQHPRPPECIGVA
jgi:hypothetical protein